MTRRQALALTLAGVAVTPGEMSAFAQSTVPLPRTTLPTRTALTRLGLERGWYAIVPLGFGSEQVQSINLAEDMFFIQTNLANLHVYEAETGKYLWGAKLGRETLDAQPVSVNSDQVFVANGPDLISLDRRTGRLIWTARMPGSAVGATAANEHRVMVGLAGGKLVSFNARDESHSKPPGRSAGTFASAWQTNANLTARPVPAGRVVAFASQDSRVYVTMEEPPTILYRYPTGGPIIGSLGTVGNRTLVIPSMDRTLYAIDLFTGDTKWTVATGAPIDQEPLVAGNVVYSLNTMGHVVAVDGTTGSVIWTGEAGRGRILAVGATKLYFESKDHDLAIVDRATGKILAMPRDTRERAGLDLRDYRYAHTNHENDRMYFATAGGFILCLREAGQSLPRPLRDPKAPKFGTLPPGGEPPTPTPPAAPTEAPPAEGASEKPAAPPEGGAGDEEKPK
ncbi:MAG: outer membrane protein assembly factor BamB, contains PQQ-like beta-propeller repeat [Planctomycetota bacterium]|nr:outer membrane protein assembly factor BamB, contains PQQ-like beta-propeller repeat [Planctomycetota bacterium]